MVALWETAPAMYNMPTTIEFHGSLKVDTLKRAMEHVVKQQEGLRTIVQFDMKENKVMQKVLPAERAGECLAFEEMEASNDEVARLIIEKESGFIFALTKPPGESQSLFDIYHPSCILIPFVRPMDNSHSSCGCQDTDYSSTSVKSACKLHIMRPHCGLF